MNVFIGHRSALEYWRSISLDSPGAYERSFEVVNRRAFSVMQHSNGKLIRLENRKDFLPKSLARTPSLAKGNPDKQILKAVEICGSGCFSSPLVCLVSSDSMRRKNYELEYRVHERSYPRGSFVRLADGIYVCSPELCFVQMAQTLPFPQLILLGFELCGAYTTHQGGYAQRPPLSTASRLRTYIDKVTGMHGVKKARRALKYLAEGSASPKESELALLLGLPCSLGGYGFGIPVMNKKIEFSGNARKASDTEKKYVDLYWPKADLGIEYDSDKEHTGSEKISKDASRRNALFAAGSQILTVTKGQIMSYAEMEKLAYTMARFMGIQIRPKKYDERARRRELRRLLL